MIVLFLSWYICFVAAIPCSIHQTHSDPLQVADDSWQTVNRCTYTFWNDSEVDAWSRPRFRYWDKLEKPILKSDVFRYLVILEKGGVYADTDTTCLRPFHEWWKGNVGCIVGLENDWISTRSNQPRVTRENQINQWVFACIPNHPLLQLVLGNIERSIKVLTRHEVNQADVLELTGPGRWTDTIREYLVARNVDWQRALGNVKVPTLLSDLLVMPTKSFSWRDSHRSYLWDDPLTPRLVQHHFKGNWKSKRKKST